MRAVFGMLVSVNSCTPQGVRYCAVREQPRCCSEEYVNWHQGIDCYYRPPTVLKHVVQKLQQEEGVAPRS